MDGRAGALLRGRDVREALPPRWHHGVVAAGAAARAPLLARGARAQAAALEASESPGAHRLAGLLRRVADGRLDPAGRVRLAAVEAARRDLLASREEVLRRGGAPQVVGRVCARASQPPAGARVLYQAVRAWAPARALELGTCLGVSAAYQAVAQERCGGGDLLTLEGYPGLAERAERLWDRLGLQRVRVVVGRFAATLPDALAEGPYGYAYVDGHHDGAATRGYVERIAAACAPGALLVLDDVDWSPSMAGAWHDVRHRPDVVASARLGKLGLAVLR
ncbi:O-methyltransferase [Vallicoccus soli]|uniref:Class I SAM-dependent methyltransferase n=1 Tax=Vallicoccus soli TaxID=2339232 RepID=A0A3A3Z487_9ACTN|nr:class I SAM-dependent methyltransferase [Vallicoccus soli]RJK98214.1 class I SAM-dependent methyltransferase [Vallicoccus soli]